MLFVGGPCTHGPGLVVSPDLKEPIRAHHDLQKDQAKHTVAASKYYSKLAEQAVTNGHVVDMFASSLDQVGVYEMKDLVRQTGGLIALADLFDNEMFQESFKKVFDRDQAGNLKMGFNSVIEVQVCAPTEQPNNNTMMMN
jgi:protein transport protein SEC23